MESDCKVLFFYTDTFFKLFNTLYLGIYSAYALGILNSNDIGTVQKKYLIIAYCLPYIEGHTTSENFVDSKIVLFGFTTICTFLV